jgi:hypothetical protein
LEEGKKLNGKRLLVGAALLVMAAMAVPSLGGEGSHATHADTITPIGHPCPECVIAVPTIVPPSISAYGASVGAAGSGFVPGSVVHVALARISGTLTPRMSQSPAVPPPANALITASMDTTASYLVDIRLWNGQHIQLEGGHISATLQEAVPPCGYYDFWVAATSVATGRTYYSIPANWGASCP